mmetsp:Transcript_34918/g.84338  ORF Transcript_34918/g.84338 Transcript_34918/m.84338 type:complete len:581 (+) Transcript_34918:83-1825(+)
MKLYTAPIPTPAAVFLLALNGGGVQSFQLPAPSVTVGSSSSATHAPASLLSEARRVWAPQLLSSSAKPAFALRSINASHDETDIDQAELELELEDDEEVTALKKRLEEIARKLELAKQRNDEVSGNVDRLREEKKKTAEENEGLIDRLKRRFMEEINDLSDKVEGTQDSMRNTFTQTRSQISDIKAESAEMEAELKAELTDLESRLRNVKLEAATVSGGRNKVKSSIQKEARDARAASRKDIDKARAEAAAEKKRLMYDSWELESRIQQAKEDAKPALKELEDAKEENMPVISKLKDTLSRVKNKFTPRIDDLKEQRAAKEMFFEKSIKDIALEEEMELDLAKSVYNADIAEEDSKLADITLSFEQLLAEKEEEVQRGIELAKEPVEMSGFGSISRAKEAMDKLLQQKKEDISNQKEERTRVVQDAVEALSLTQDKYDADLENAERNLVREKERLKRTLRKEDSRREGRKVQLQSQKEELVRKLAQLTEDERVKADADMEQLSVAKVAQLEDSTVRVNIASKEIQTMRYDQKLVSYELTQLENASQKKQVAIDDLEEERASFRKQARRTVSVAINKLRRR